MEKVSGEVEERVKSVFISYSWTNEELRTWVRDVLATRLMGDGVEVKLDAWDFKEGHDKFVFMESMVKNPQIDKVLVICDRYYTEKADSREGGVGDETQIITPHVYQSTTQEKFIPIIYEYDEANQPYLPTYLKSRKYFDMSNDESYLENYINLLRFIFDRPEYRKPKLGTPPDFLFEDTYNDYKLESQIQLILQHVSKGRFDIAKTSVNEFKKLFLKELHSEEIRVETETQNVTQAVLNAIDNMLQLKKSFNKYLISCLDHNLITSETIIAFLEDASNEIIFVKEEIINGKPFNDYQFEGYWFLLHEIFLNITTILLKKEKFDILSDILHSKYLIFRDFSGNPKEYRDFQCFYSYAESLEDRTSGYDIGRYSSTTANKILSRIDTDEFMKKEIVETDLILNLVSNTLDMHFFFKWYPVLKNSQGYGKIEFLQRLVSKRHCERVKSIFEAETINDLKEKLLRLSELKKSNSDEGKAIYVIIEQHIDLNEIGTDR